MHTGNMCKHFRFKKEREEKRLLIESRNHVQQTNELNIYHIQDAYLKENLHQKLQNPIENCSWEKEILFYNTVSDRWKDRRTKYILRKNKKIKIVTLK